MKAKKRVQCVHCCKTWEIDTVGIKYCLRCYKVLGKMFFYRIFEEDNE